MFGSLKKKLQEAVKKVSGSVEKPIEEKQPQTDERLPEIRKEEYLHEEKQIEQPIKEAFAKHKEVFAEIEKEAAIEKEQPVKEESSALPEEDVKLEMEVPVQEKPIEKLPEHEIISKKEEYSVNEDKNIYEIKPEELKSSESLAEEIAKRPWEEKEGEVEIIKQPSKVEKTFEKAIDEVEETSAALEEKIEALPQKKKLFGIFGRKKEEPKISEPKSYAAVAEEEKRSILSRVLEKELSADDVSSILKELEMAMLENDVAVEVVEKISLELKKQLVGARVKRGEAENVITDALRNAMIEVMKQKPISIDELIEKKSGPLLVVMLGFNGVGKTTTLAKIANKYKKYSPVLAAGDTFRAASIEQLEEHSKRLNSKLVKSKYGADSAAVIFDAMKHAVASGNKLVLADTAGRSHTNINLMDELRKVCRANKPDLKVLVLDSLAGNDIYEQARLFDEAVGVDAIILTKSDVYDRGGAALSAAYALKKPILFLGTGQEYEDLIEFSAELIVKNLLE